MPTAHPLEKQPDRRHHIVGWAHFGVLYNKHFTYSEGDDRMSAIGTKPGTLPVTCDCSAFVTLMYFWGGAPDPNGLNFDHEGYTGTLISHDEHIQLFRKNAKEIDKVDVLPGDLIVYGPDTGEHVAMVVVPGADPITVSMGEQGDPHFVKVSQDGREPQTYLRCETRQRPGFVA